MRLRALEQASDASVVSEPMCKVLILLEEKGVVRYAKMAAAAGTGVARHFGLQRRCFGYGKAAQPMMFGAGHLVTAWLSRTIV